MKAYQVMIHPPITVHAHTPVPEIARLMTTHRLTGLPVVDEHMRVVGIISEDNLSVCERALPFSEIKLLHLFGQWIEPTQIIDVSGLSLTRKE